MFTQKQQLELAQNPNTNAKTLLKLASLSNESSVLAAIARNPNSPPELLIQLAGEYFEEIAKNPAIKLILIEQPDFVLRAHCAFLKKLGFQYKDTYVGYKDLTIMERQIKIEDYIATIANWEISSYVSKSKKIIHLEAIEINSGTFYDLRIFNKPLEVIDEPLEIIDESIAQIRKLEKLVINQSKPER